MAPAENTRSSFWLEQMSCHNLKERKKQCYDEDEDDYDDDDDDDHDDDDHHDRDDDDAYIQKARVLRVQTPPILGIFCEILG